MADNYVPACAPSLLSSPAQHFPGPAQDSNKSEPKRIGQHDQTHQNIDKADAFRDEFFRRILQQLANTDVFSHPATPSVFIVYAHDNLPHRTAHSQLVKLLIEWLSIIRSRTVSDKKPLPLFASRSENSARNIVSNQICLLPGECLSPEKGTIVSVDKVVVCASEVLKGYFEHSFTSNYIAGINSMCQDQGPVSNKLHDLPERIHIFAEKHCQSDGFHHVLTELAILKIRARQSKPHGIIPVTLSGSISDYSSLFEEIGLRPTDLIIDLELPLEAKMQQLFFKLLKQIYVKHHVLIDYFRTCFTRGIWTINQNMSMDEENVQHMFSSEILKAKEEYSEFLTARIRNGSIQTHSETPDQDIIQALAKLRKPGDVIEVLLQMAETRKRDCHRKRKQKRAANGRVVVLRDNMEKLICWIEKFKVARGSRASVLQKDEDLHWSAVRFILQATANNEEAFDAVSDCLETVAKSIARHRIAVGLLEKTSCSIELKWELQTALSSLYVEILKFLSKAVKYFKAPRARRTPKNPLEAIDGFHVTKVLAKDREVHQICTFIARREESNTTTKPVEWESLTPNLEAEYVRTRAQNEPVTALQSNYYLDILKWLSTIGYHRIHQFHSRNRLPETGRWLLSHDGYIDWRSSSCSSIMILHGILGSGKTTLCSRVVDSFRGTAKTGATEGESVAPLAYFYCSNTASEPERRNPTEVFRSIVRQITFTKTSEAPDSQLTAPNIIVGEYKTRLKQSEEDGFDLEKLSSQDCIAIIGRITDKEPITVVIDALDELQDDESRCELVIGLQQVVKNAANVVKIFLTSRDGGPIFSLLPDAIKIRISGFNSASDVATFTRHHVQRAIDDCRLLGGKVPEILRSKICQALIDKAGEMFVSVKMQLNNICRVKTESDVLEILYDLPTALEATYKSLLGDVLTDKNGKHGSKIARHAFSWLLHASRPLSSNGLLQAVSSSIPKIREGSAQEITAPMIEECCAHLVCLDSDSDVFRLAHPSVQEYLLLQPEFSPDRSFAVLAESCLFSCSEGAYQEDQDEACSNSITSHVGFPDYASMYWAQHYYQATRAKPNKILRSEMISFVFGQFDESEPAESFLIWLDSIRRRLEKLPITDKMFKKLHALISANDDPLFTAAEFGLIEIMEQLGTRNVTNHDWNSRNQLGDTALYLAAVSGHADIAEYLVKKGAGINIVGGKKGHCLFAAAFYGHGVICHMLLEHGADPRQSVHGVQPFGNVVEAALAGGHKDLAQDLLAISNVKSRLTDEDLEQIMIESCRGGFVDIVSELDSRSDTTSTQSVQSRMIQAIRFGKPGIIRYLINKYKDNDDILPADAIALAALHGHQDLIDICLQRGLSIDQPGAFGSPIRAASLMGYRRIVQFLLEKGARTDHDNPLQAAALRGHADVIECLIDIGGLDASYLSSEYETPITSAAYRGHEAAVRVLLDAGASPSNSSGPSSKFTNAFHAAIEGGSDTILDLFHKRGFIFEPTAEMGLTIDDLARRGEERSAPTFLKMDLSQRATDDGTDELIRKLEHEANLSNRGNTPSYRGTRGGGEESSLSRVSLYMDEVKNLLDQLRVTGYGLPTLTDLFHRAVRAGNLELVQLIAPEVEDLIFGTYEEQEFHKRPHDNGKSRMNHLTEDGNPLMVAATLGHIDTFEYLLLFGNGDSNIVPLFKAEKLLLSASSNNVQAFERIMEYLVTICANEPGQRSNIVQLLQKSMEASIDVEALEVLAMMIGTQGISLEYSFSESIREAWEQGFSHQETLGVLWSQSTNKRTHRTKCLRSAVKVGNYQVVRLLMCLNPEVPESIPLIACHEGHFEIASFLFKTSVSHSRQARNVLNKGLILACQNGHSSIVEMMIERGANLKARVQCRALQQPVEMPKPDPVMRDPFRAARGEISRSDMQIGPGAGMPSLMKRALHARYLAGDEIIVLDEEGDLRDRLAPVGFSGTASPLIACLIGFLRFDLDDEAFKNPDLIETLDEALRWESRGRSGWRLPSSLGGPSIPEDLTFKNRYNWALKAGSEQRQRNILRLLLNSGVEIDQQSGISYMEHPVLLFAAKHCSPEVVSLISKHSNIAISPLFEGELVSAVINRRICNLEAALALSCCNGLRATESSSKQGLPRIFAHVDPNLYIKRIIKGKRESFDSRIYSVIMDSLNRGWIEDEGLRYIQKGLSKTLDGGLELFIKAILSSQQRPIADNDRAFLLLLSATTGSPEWIEVLLRHSLKHRDAFQNFWQGNTYDASPLEVAAYQGHLRFLEKLLPRWEIIYPSLETYMARLQRALHAAIMMKQGQVATYLIGTARQLESPWDELDSSLLPHAAKSQLPNVVKLLLEVGISVDIVGKLPGEHLRAPALYYSCQCSDSMIPQMLINAGADATWLYSDPNADSPQISETKNGLGPLHMACKYGNVNAMSALIRQGADPNARSSIGTPLICAIEGGSLECVKLILETVCEEDEQVLGGALDVCIRMRDPNLVDELLDWGAPVFGSSEGRTRNPMAGLLDHPVVMSDDEHSKSLKIAMQLLNEIGKLDTDDLEKASQEYALKSSSRLEPLQEVATEAVKCRDVRFFDLLTDYLPDDVSWFHRACALGSVRTVRKMISQGIEVDALDDKGLRGIHMAACNLHWEVVEVLLNSGADINHPSERFGSPLMAALEGCLDKMFYEHPGLGNIRQLITGKKRVQLPNGEWTWFNFGNHPAQIRDSVKYEPKVFPRPKPTSLSTNKLEPRNTDNMHISNDPAMEPVQSTSSKPQIALLRTLQILLGHGANANPQPSPIGTSLQMACFIRSESIVKILLEHGADVNGTGGWLESPLRAALHSGTADQIRAIVLLLLQSGADISMPTATEGSYLDIAYQLKGASTIRMLLEHGGNSNEVTQRLLNETFNSRKICVLWLLLHYGQGLRVERRHEMLAAGIQGTFLGQTALEWLTDYRSRYPELCWVGS